MKRNELEKQRMSMIEGYRSSGLPAVQWCEEHGVKVSTLRYWITKLNRLKNAIPAADGFVEFSTAANKTSPIIVYIGPARIELKAGLSMNQPSAHTEVKQRIFL